jgi:KUP system potassium uptake protein
MVLAERLRSGLTPLESFAKIANRKRASRVPGMAVYMSRNPEGAPPALIHNFEHNKVIHENVVVLSVITDEVPHVQRKDRISLKTIGNGFYSVVAHYGFMQSPDIYEIADCCKNAGLELAVDQSTFFLGRETLIASERPGMAMWREELFAFMTRNAQRAKNFYNIPTERMIEIGVQIEL